MTNATSGTSVKRKREDSDPHDCAEPARPAMRWEGSVCFTQIPATVERVLSTFDQCVSNAVSQASESVRDTIIPMVQEVVDKEFNQLKEAVGKITELRVQNERLLSDIALKNGLTYDLENLVKSDQEVIQKAAKEISALKQAVLVSENARMDLQNKLQEEKQRSEALRQQAEASATERDATRGTLAKTLAQSSYYVSEIDRLQNQNTDLQTNLEKASTELLTEQKRSEKLAANAKKSERKLIGLQSNMAHIQSMMTQALGQ